MKPKAILNIKTELKWLQNPVLDRPYLHILPCGGNNTRKRPDFSWRFPPSVPWYIILLDGNLEIDAHV